MRRLYLTCGALGLLAVVGLIARPAFADETAAANCICALVEAAAGPGLNGLGASRPGPPEGSGPVQIDPTADLQAFADAVQDCLQTHDEDPEFKLERFTCPGAEGGGMGGSFTIEINIRTTKSSGTQTAKGNEDVVIAVGGDASATSTSAGQPAKATNTSTNGAAVAVGGDGGGNDTNPGQGGLGTAVSKDGDAVAGGGEGGDPGDNAKAGGTGGSAKATSNHGASGTQTGLPGAPAPAGGNPQTGTKGGGAKAQSGANDNGEQPPGPGASSNNGGTTPNQNNPQ